MATPRHAWQRPRPPRHASQRPRHALQRPRPPLASQLIRQQVEGFFFDVELLGPCKKACRGRRGRCQACLGRPRIYGSLVVHYSLSFIAYKAVSGGVFLRCGTPKTLRKGMPRTPRTLPSMPRSCQASLHILGSHIYIYIYIGLAIRHLFKYNNI